MRGVARRGIGIGAGLVAAALLAPSSALAGGCPTIPTWDPAITSPAEAIPEFTQRQATADELNDYFELVDSETARVAVDQFGSSQQGRPMLYALAGDAATVGDADQVAADQRQLADPRVTGSGEAADLAADSPAIAWYAANVHGNEPSGGDAAASILYDIAARTDCEAVEIRDNLLVGVIPVQNPDGRELGRRTNIFYFDMNRDWFARTQPETDSKLDLLAQYPPTAVFVDAHEMSGGKYFFPPNADPIHHEISPEVVSNINDLYGPALAEEFDAQRADQPSEWQFFNYSIYDLFYMGYGDTVPSTAFTAAGMTFEKGGGDPYPQRELEQRVAGWTTLRAAAENKEQILADYYQAHVDAISQGEQGILEPNEVVQPGNEVRNEVPDIRVRNYFLPGDSSFSDVRTLLDRLLSTGVEVYRLTAPLNVADYEAYGRDASARVLAAGSYWIPLDQPQKHWIQALLGEDTYVPFPYFYDVTAWSNPLLMNLDAGFSEAAVSPAADPVTEVPPTGVNPGADPDYFSFEGDTGKAVAAAIKLARDGNSVERLGDGTFVVDDSAEGSLDDLAADFGLVIDGQVGSMPTGVEVPARRLGILQGGGESRGHFRFLFKDVWDVPFQSVRGTDIKNGALSDGDIGALLVPGIYTNKLTKAKPQLKQWIKAGGVYIGTTRAGDYGGTPWAVHNGLTSSRVVRSPSLQVPGTLFRIQLDELDSPLTTGAPSDFDYQFHLGEKLLMPTETGENVATYPAGEPDFFRSGFARNAGVLKGSAALVDEQLGDGHVVLFSGEPNYRAYTEGTAFLFANALAYPEDAPLSRGVDVGSAAAAGAVAAARASASAPETGRAPRIEVPASQAAAAAQILRESGVPGVGIETAGSSAFLEIPNPLDLDASELPYTRGLVPALQRSGITVLSAVF